MRKALGLVVLLAAFTGCLPGPGATIKGSGSLTATVYFDHNCPPEKTRVIRWFDNVGLVDLDVCGAVRRYKMFGSTQQVNGAIEPTWLDVTPLYPKGSLSEPLTSEPRKPGS